MMDPHLGLPHPMAKMNRNGLSATDTIPAPVPNQVLLVAREAQRLNSGGSFK